ncbi:MAG: hypothetical protein ACMG6E_00570 [Candidatus Roizmanbacteria bacterium]
MGESIKTTPVTGLSPTGIIKTTNPKTTPSPTPSSIKKQLIIASIFGYTSPKSLVFLQTNIADISTTSDKEGFFSFNSISLPSSTSEICIHSIDSFGRNTQASCIPFLDSYIGYHIGPILLSPTISLNKNMLKISENAIISGSSLPSSKIFLYFSQDSQHLFNNKEIPSQPILIEAQTDSNGNYSIKFDSSKPIDGKIFTTAKRGIDNTASSNKLDISYLPYWLILLNMLIRALLSLQGDYLFIYFIIEALGVVILIYFLLWKKDPPRALAILEDHIILLKSAITKISNPLVKAKP